MNVLILIGIILASTQTAAVRSPRTDENPKIDMAGFLDISAQAAQHRSTRRISEEEFIRMSQDPGTIVLDARSQEKFDLLHIRGAVHLSFPDFTEESLTRMIPDPSTRILIYCNNNFENAEQAFPTKMAPAALNLATYVSLYTYGYRNVYELAPLLDPATSKIQFESNTSLPEIKPSPLARR